MRKNGYFIKGRENTRHHLELDSVGRTINKIHAKVVTVHLGLTEEAFIKAYKHQMSRPRVQARLRVKGMLNQKHSHIKKVQK